VIQSPWTTDSYLPSGQYKASLGLQVSNLQAWASIPRTSISYGFASGNQWYDSGYLRQYPVLYRMPGEKRVVKTVHVPVASGWRFMMPAMALPTASDLSWRFGDLVVESARAIRPARGVGRQETAPASAALGGSG